MMANAAKSQPQMQSPVSPMGVGGQDPYNSVQGTPGPAGTAANDDDVAGSVPANSDPQHVAIIRAMHNAYSNKGVNPLNSHPEQAKKWERSWKDKTNRQALKAAGGLEPDTGDQTEAIGFPARREAQLVDQLKETARARAARAGLRPSMYTPPGMSGALPIKR